MHRYTDTPDKDILVPLLLPVRLAVEVDVDHVHRGQVVEVEVLPPEAHLPLLLGRRPRVQRLVQAELGEVALLVGHPLGLQDPDLERVVRAPHVLLVGLHRAAQAVHPLVALVGGPAREVARRAGREGHLEAVLPAQHGGVQGLDLDAAAAAGPGRRAQVQGLHDALAGEQRLVGTGGPEPRGSSNTVRIKHPLSLQLGDTLGPLEGVGTERPLGEEVHYPGGGELEAAAAEHRGGGGASPPARLLVRGV